MAENFFHRSLNCDLQGERKVEAKARSKFARAKFAGASYVLLASCWIINLTHYGACEFARTRASDPANLQQWCHADLPQSKIQYGRRELGIRSQFRREHVSAHDLAQTPSINLHERANQLHQERSRSNAKGEQREHRGNSPSQASGHEIYEITNDKYVEDIEKLITSDWPQTTSPIVVTRPRSTDELRVHAESTTRK